MIRPLGLITQPSQYGSYPDGACKRAENCVARNPGDLVSAPGMYASSTVGGASSTVHKLVPLDAGHVYELTASGSTWTVTESGSAVSIPTGYSATNLFSATGRISPVRQRERVLVNSQQGYLVGDSMSPSSPATRALRPAGLPQPQLVAVGNFPGTSIPANIAVGYALALRRHFADGYEIVSVPSVVWQFYTYAPAGPVITITWTSAAGIVLAGDILEVYRTDGLATNDPNADPGTTLKLIKAYTLTAADIVTGNVALADSATCEAPYYVTEGENLYTNPFEESALGANRQPPIAACTCAFKGYTFYGSTTDRPSWSFSSPAGFGSTQNTALNNANFRAYGLGERRGAGTVTSGSAVITAVSATDIVGIVYGQQWSIGVPGFASTATVIAVGATTITMSANANANAAAFALRDVVQIDGALFAFDSLMWLMYQLTAGAKYELSVDACITFPAATTVRDRGFNFELEPVLQNVMSVTVRGTNGANYSPPIPEITAAAKTITATPAKNHLQWSKSAQPEHAPAANETTVGTGEIYAMAPTTDAIWIACSDGVYRLSGDGGVWRIDTISTNVILCAPGAWAVLDDAVYAYSGAGVTRLADQLDAAAGASTLVIGDLLPGAAYVETGDILMASSERDQEIYLTPGKSSNVLYVLNTRTKAWTTLTTLSAITALAWQRTPGGVTPARLLVGVSPAGLAPSYAGWGDPASHMPMKLQFQPFYVQDPLSIKQWISCTFMFDPAGAGAGLTPSWNGAASGAVTVTVHETGAYATCGPDRSCGVSHAIAPGYTESVMAGSPLRFQGLSLLYSVLTETQAKEK